MDSFTQTYGCMHFSVRKILPRTSLFLCRTDKIAIIDPADGAVVKWISAEGMHRKKRGEDVLNGIAFDPSTRRLWVTGIN